MQKHHGLPYCIINTLELPRLPDGMISLSLDPLIFFINVSLKTWVLFWTPPFVSFFIPFILQRLKVVSPISPSTFSTSMVATNSLSMSTEVHTTHNFFIFGLKWARNLLYFSTSRILPFTNKRSSPSYYSCTHCLGSCLMASILTSNPRHHMPHI